MQDFDFRKDLDSVVKVVLNPDAFKPTVVAIRNSMQAGLRVVFLLGAVSMLISFLLILTVPEISMAAVVEDKKAPQPALAAEAAE